MRLGHTQEATDTEWGFSANTFHVSADVIEACPPLENTVGRKPHLPMLWILQKLLFFAL